ncbi:hypothetical protein TNCT_194821, partial [Trichonephila clavata]
FHKPWEITFNILEVLSHTSWGFDHECFLRVFRSKLDYGNMVNTSARKSVYGAFVPYIKSHRPYSTAF